MISNGVNDVLYPLFSSRHVLYSEGVPDSHDTNLSNRERKTLARRRKAVESVEEGSFDALATALREVGPVVTCDRGGYFQ